MQVEGRGDGQGELVAAARDAAVGVPAGSRSRPPCAYRPLESKPSPTTGFPSRTSSVTITRTLTSILEKLLNALDMSASMGTVVSRMSTMRTPPNLSHDEVVRLRTRPRRDGPPDPVA